MDIEIIKRRPLIIGIAIILAMYITSDMISGVSLVMPSFLLAGIVVGFMVNENIKTGAINGAIMGLIGSIIVNIVLIAMIYLQGYGAYISSIALYYLLYLVIEIIVATAGGVLGFFIESETLEEVEPDSP